MVEKLGSNNNSAEKRHRLYGELVKLEDRREKFIDLIRKTQSLVNEITNSLHEDDEIAEVIIETEEEIELQRILEDIEIITSEIQRHEGICLGEMKSLEEISGMFTLNDNVETAEESESRVDDMVDNMFDGFDINTDEIPLLDIDDLLDDEINGCLDNVFEVKRGED